jgi:hypothetical protein
MFKEPKKSRVQFFKNTFFYNIFYLLYSVSIEAVKQFF